MNFLCAKMFFMLAERLQTIPTQPGTYALWLHLPQPQDLTIGKLGCFTFPAGDYFYLGSARGPGGLCARLGRHLSEGCSERPGRTHWHIDYLRAAAQMRGFGYSLKTQGEPPAPPQECAWSQYLVSLPGASFPVRGFGASDCRWGCAAHLVYFPKSDVSQITRRLHCKIHLLGNE